MNQSTKDPPLIEHSTTINGKRVSVVVGDSAEALAVRDELLGPLRPTPSPAQVVVRGSRAWMSTAAWESHGRMERAAEEVARHLDLERLIAEGREWTM